LSSPCQGRERVWTTAFPFFVKMKEGPDAVAIMTGAMAGEEVRGG
jgi:hypothetical protein